MFLCRVALVGAALTGGGCGDDAPPASMATASGSSAGSGRTSTSVISDGLADDTLADDTLAGGSTASETTAAPEQCVALFGRPNEATGLTDEQCRPECPCLDGWVAPTYDDAAIAALEALTLANPPEPLDADPYLTPERVEASPGQVCGVVVDGDSYTLTSYDGEAAAQRAGATVSHDGACGRCSPLHDLAVYMRSGDLTDPVRACGLLGLTRGDDANLQCLLDIGFSMPCAQIWLYNTIHTRTECTEACLGALDEPYHLPDGTLNACLTCDEQLSGPVFKAVAGRTRRNTGLPSALCRPCDDVMQLLHVYR